MAQTADKTLGERLDALKVPSPKIDSYGTHACGCTWDSGPYGVFCGTYDGERLGDDAFRALYEAAVLALRERDVSHLESVIVDVGRIVNEGVDPAT